MIAGAALLVLAAWSPFGLLRLIPMMEVAAGSVVGQRAAMSGAAGSAGIHSPASYMRQAMDRQSRASTSPAYSGAPRTVYGPPSGAAGETAPLPALRDDYGGARAGAASTGASRATYARAESATTSAPTATAGCARQAAAVDARQRHRGRRHGSSPTAPPTSPA